MFLALLSGEPDKLSTSNHCLQTLMHRYFSTVIGEGGMGKVYKAHDTVLGRQGAVKMLPTELAGQPGYRERFQREAHTAAQLTELHIIPIHDAAEIDGRVYRAMPAIADVDVASLLKRAGQ